MTLALGSRTEATALAEWPDGSLLAAGAVAAEDGERWFVAKLTSKGARDGRFGAGGIVKPLAPGGSPSVVSAVALANGRSELLGRSGDAVLLLRLLGSGARDGAFGDRGAVELPLDTAAGLVVDAAGRSVVGGSAGGALVAVERRPCRATGRAPARPGRGRRRRDRPPAGRSGPRRGHLIRGAGRRALDERRVARPTVRLGRRHAARGIRRRRRRRPARRPDRRGRARSGRPAAPVCSGSSSAAASTQRSARTGSRARRPGLVPAAVAIGPERALPRGHRRRPSAGDGPRAHVVRAGAAGPAGRARRHRRPDLAPAARRER